MKNCFCLVVALGLFALGGCYRAEYRSSFISPDPKEFDTYQKECAGRPSPPARTMRSLGGTDVFITYNRPAVKGRAIWGGLVPYGKIWRTGANEATVFSVTGDVLVNGDTLLSGNYALYTVPTEGDWTVIFNAKYETWGAYDYDEALDVLCFEVSPTANGERTERLAFGIGEDGTVRFAWDSLGFGFRVAPF